MANIKVSEMTQAENVNNNDWLMIVQNATNKKVTKQVLMSDLSSRIDGIETEQTTQNENIQSNSDNIETLQTEVTELQEDVQNLRNASYKVSGSGTNFSLNNTTKNKFIEFLLGGNTEQTHYDGRNIIDGTNPTSTNYATASMTENTIKVSSTATNTTPFVRYEFDNVAEGDVFRINSIIKNSNGRIVLQKNQNGWATASMVDYSDGTSISSIVYTAEAGVTGIRYLLYANKSTPTGASESNYENVIATKNNSNMEYEQYVRSEYQALIQHFLKV